MTTLTASILALLSCTTAAQDKEWDVHDRARPQPPIVDPGTIAPRPVGSAPSDAVVLFDGRDLSAWMKEDGTSAEWTVTDGVMTVGRGDIRTRAAFGSCQLHLEWATPREVKGQGQGRGNSGVFLMGQYEVQVLDSYDNQTYPDGQAAAIYGQTPPLVNACRKPGEWQSYDIIFRRPLFDDHGQLRCPATLTVLHNGVLVHDHVALRGATRHKQRAEYAPHPDQLPLKLQDHGNPVQYRNIWIRPLD